MLLSILCANPVSHLWPSSVLDSFFPHERFYDENVVYGIEQKSKCCIFYTHARRNQYEINTKCEPSNDLDNDHYEYVSVKDLQSVQSENK